MLHPELSFASIADPHLIWKYMLNCHEGWQGSKEVMGSEEDFYVFHVRMEEKAASCKKHDTDRRGTFDGRLTYG